MLSLFTVVCIPSGSHYFGAIELIDLFGTGKRKTFDKKITSFFKSFPEIYINIDIDKSQNTTKIKNNLLEVCECQKYW